VPLNRALSKLGLLSRADATAAIVSGRVRIDGRIVTDPSRLVVPERIRVAIDGDARSAPTRRTILLHKPAGVLTTRADPEGRPTIYDVLGQAASGLVPVGRLDRATTGLLILTNDTQLAERIASPARAVPRLYVVTVRGRVSDEDAVRLTGGIDSRGERLTADRVLVRKRSNRESHLTIELHEGKNREVRRLFEAVGHEVTRLKRVRLGGLDLGDLAPGAWRELTASEIERAFGSK
jgi:23S rRNA pseudouridine2605 synthase